MSHAIPPNRTVDSGRQNRGVARLDQQPGYVERIELVGLHQTESCSGPARPGRPAIRH